ncbi:MAG: hypothetical protein ABL909_03085 [Sphingopyxis sp.]
MVKASNILVSKKLLYHIVLTVYFSLASQMATAQAATAQGTLEERINRFLAQFDANADGAVTRAEFRDGVVRQNSTMNPQRIDDNMNWLFPRFDMDGNGVITRADLVRNFAQSRSHNAQ